MSGTLILTQHRFCFAGLYLELDEFQTWGLKLSPTYLRYHMPMLELNDGVCLSRLMG